MPILTRFFHPFILRGRASRNQPEAIERIKSGLAMETGNVKNEIPAK